MLEDLHLRDPYDGFVFLAESVRNPPMLKPHRHVEPELNLVVGGEIRYVVDDRSYHFTAGTLLWLFPGQVHQLVDRTPEAAYYVAVFRPDRLASLRDSDRYRALLGDFPPGEGVLSHRPPSGSFQMLRQMMGELCAGGLDPDLLNREAGFGLTPGFHFEHSDPVGLNAGLKHLYLCAWRMTESGRREDPMPPLHPAVRRALEQIRISDPPPRLAELAPRCGVSASTVSRLFRAQMGIPLNRYRNSVMLSRFMACMSSKDQPTILEAVHAAGFGSYAQFHRVFHQAYGQGPREALFTKKG
ncbi:MAG: helix-turn-helix transcriptional regulator [Verrucomicrobia bacterium]|nr:helix-turn-helix transcriptional regulator [Verrucomicrobiota bacterium]MCH8527659.1 AraC family transcriptional regulator [Kiritimatiellia bacterium]